MAVTPGCVLLLMALLLSEVVIYLTACSSVPPLLAVSIEDIQEVRMGHRTEGLEKFARDIPEDRCFSIVFKDNRNTLDLIAPSSADVQHWVEGLRKIIHHSGSMNQRQKLQQYPPGGRGSWLAAACGLVSCGAVTKYWSMSVTLPITVIFDKNKPREEVFVLWFGRMQTIVAGKASW